MAILGINVFSELGMGISEGMVPVEKTATLASLSGIQIFACIWQIGILILLGVFLWKVGESLLEKCVMVLMLLASLASAAVMYFSPTMYVSGARVMFVTAVLLWLLTGILFAKVKNYRLQSVITGYVAVAGVANVIAYAVNFIK